MIITSIKPSTPSTTSKPSKDIPSKESASAKPSAPRTPRNGDSSKRGSQRLSEPIGLKSLSATTSALAADELRSRSVAQQAATKLRVLFLLGGAGGMKKIIEAQTKVAANR